MISMTQALLPLASPGPLTLRNAVLNTGVKVHREGIAIVLLQKTRLWFRAAVCFWATIVLLTPFMIYSEIFTSQTTTFTCDRGAGICAVNGRTNDVPRLADITRAEMDHDFNRRDGRHWGINLLTRDGKRHSIEQQRAIKNTVVDDYRTAVKAINAFLGDHTRQKLDTSFTYHAALSEVLQSFFYLFFGVAALFAAFPFWTKRRYTFEPGKIAFQVRRPFQRETQEIATDRITAIVDRPGANRRIVGLKLDDGSSISLIEAGPDQAPKANQLAKELAGILGKPLQISSA